MNNAQPENYTDGKDHFPKCADATARAWSKSLYANEADTADEHSKAARLHESAQRLHLQAAKFSADGPFSAKPYHLRTAQKHGGMRDEHSAKSWRARK